MKGTNIGKDPYIVCARVPRRSQHTKFQQFDPCHSRLLDSAQQCVFARKPCSCPSFTLSKTAPEELQIHSPT